MESKGVKKLASDIPTLKRVLNFSKTEASKGTNIRSFLFGLFVFHFFTLLDAYGGIATFGFARTSLRNEYKIKPDYLTGTLFIASRKTLPEYKYF